MPKAKKTVLNKGEKTMTKNPKKVVVLEHGERQKITLTEFMAINSLQLVISKTIGGNIVIQLEPTAPGAVPVVTFSEIVLNPLQPSNLKRTEKTTKQAIDSLLRDLNLSLSFIVYYPKELASEESPGYITSYSLLLKEIVDDITA